MDESKMKHPQNITAAAAAADNLQTPAYTGARFNSLGFCINHHNVRLCTVTSGGKYKILRKICPKCGSNSLRSNLTRFRVTTLHGLGKKELPTREVPKDKLSAIEGGSGSGGDKKIKASDKAAKKSSGPLLEKNGTTDMKKKKSVLPQQPNTKVRQSKRSTASSPTPQLGGGKSKSECKSRQELPDDQPPSQQRPRSKSRTRKKTTRKEDDKPARSRSSTPIPDKPARSRSSTPIPNKPARSRSSTPVLTNMSSSKSVEAKVKDITNKFADGTLEKAIDYAELGKLITMKESDEDTLPTVPSEQSTVNKSVEEKVKELTKSLVANYTELDKLIKMKDDEFTLTTSPSQTLASHGPFKRQLSEMTSGSFKSKQAVLSIDESGLIVELYEKNSDGLVGQEKKSSGSGNGLKLRRSPKLKQKILTN
jgi:hypothetical protein